MMPLEEQDKPFYYNRNACENIIYVIFMFDIKDKHRRSGFKNLAIFIRLTIPGYVRYVMADESNAVKCG